MTDILHERIQTHKDGTKERWRDVVGYSGLYRISDRGRIKSVARRVWTNRDGGFYTYRPTKILLNRLDYNGKCTIGLSKDGKRKLVKVARLVLETFVGPCPPGMQACHFPDRNLLNNRVENLRWDTPKANCKDRDLHGTTSRGNTSGVAKLTEDQAREVHQIYSNKTISHTACVKQLTQQFGVAKKVLFGILQGTSFKHLGLVPVMPLDAGSGKSRFNGGENHGNAKLTSDDVKFIRAKFKSGQMTIEELSKLFPVIHISNLKAAAVGRTYKNVT